MTVRTLKRVAQDNEGIRVSRAVHYFQDRATDDFILVRGRRAIGTGELFASVMRTELVLVGSISVFVDNAAELARTTPNFGIEVHHRLCIQTLAFYLFVDCRHNFIWQYPPSREVLQQFLSNSVSFGPIIREKFIKRELLCCFYTAL